MYFLVKGSCLVNLDSDNELTDETRVLAEGSHFGEVSLVEICSRTATVIGRDYNTLGTMSYDAFLQVNHYFPRYKELLKEHMRKHYLEFRRTPGDEDDE